MDPQVEDFKKRRELMFAEKENPTKPRYTKQTFEERMKEKTEWPKWPAIYIYLKAKDVYCKQYLQFTYNRFKNNENHTQKVIFNTIVDRTGKRVKETFLYLWTLMEKYVEVKKNRQEYIRQLKDALNKIKPIDDQSTKDVCLEAIQGTPSADRKMFDLILEKFFDSNSIKDETVLTNDQLMVLYSEFGIFSFLYRQLAQLYDKYPKELKLMKPCDYKVDFVPATEIFRDSKFSQPILPNKITTNAAKALILGGLCEDRLLNNTLVEDFVKALNGGTVDIDVRRFEELRIPKQTMEYFKENGVERPMMFTAQLGRQPTTPSETDTKKEQTENTDSAMLITLGLGVLVVGWFCS